MSYSEIVLCGLETGHRYNFITIYYHSEFNNQTGLMENITLTCYIGTFMCNERLNKWETFGITGLLPAWVICVKPIEPS